MPIERPWVERKHSYSQEFLEAEERRRQAAIAEEEQRKADNEAANRRWQQELAAKQAADEAERQRQRDEAAAVQIEAYRKQIRASFVGNDAQFEAAWPQLLASWQIQQVEEAQQKLRAMVARDGRYSL